MQLLQARILANHYLNLHGLSESGWRFVFDDSVSHFGCCDYNKKVIFLSKPMTLTITEEKTIDTILHECAHAIVGPGHGHDAEWKKVAKSIGCRGERCGNINKEALNEVRLEKFKKLKYKYTYTCPTCKFITFANEVHRDACCQKEHDPIKYKIKKN